MESAPTKQPAIIRTERGLVIAGTRVTLYQIMDYIHANYPRHLIRHQFHITDEKFNAAMSYIDTHYEEIEQEYQTVIRQAEETRKYWKERNKDRVAAIAQTPPQPEYQAAWEKYISIKYKNILMGINENRDRSTSLTKKY